MRYAFVSDVHGNLQAWNTVLADLSVHRVDRIVCLGDVVGYGPEPAECLRSVHARCHAILLGNHDAVVGGRMSASTFNDRARRMIEWTQTRLGDRARELFSHLPLVLRGPGFRCVHGDFTDPAVFRYVRTPDEAAANFAATTEPLLFCGHTHEAEVFLTGGSGRVYKIEPQDFALEEGKRYLVNVGSVGVSRDADPRASYVIYDEERRAVYFHRVPFDFEAFRAAVARAPGLDPALVPALRAASGEDGVVREEADFSPSRGERVEGGVREADVNRRLARSNVRLRVAACAAAALAVALAVGAWRVWENHRSHAVSYPPEDAAPIAASVADGPDADGNVLPRFNPSSVGGFSCPPYRVDLSDDRTQSVLIQDWLPVLSSGSAEAGPVRLRAPRVDCAPGAKLEAMCRVRLSDDFQGVLELTATLEKTDGSLVPLFQKVFNQGAPVGVAESSLPVAIQALRPAEGWRLARGTTDRLPQDASGVLLEVSGAFSGRVTVGALTARRK